VPRAGRIPHGFLYHGVKDEIVPVVFTCILSDALGSNATTRLQAYGHNPPDGRNGLFEFATQAWADLSKHRLP
jgi:hypothetical protein